MNRAGREITVQLPKRHVEISCVDFTVPEKMCWYGHCLIPISVYCGYHFHKKLSDTAAEVHVWKLSLVVLTVDSVEPGMNCPYSVLDSFLQLPYVIKRIGHTLQDSSCNVN